MYDERILCMGKHGETLNTRFCRVFIVEMYGGCRHCGSEIFTLIVSIFCSEKIPRVSTYRLHILR